MIVFQNELKTVFPDTIDKWLLKQTKKSTKQTNKQTKKRKGNIFI
jgi:hypothetical protein